MPGRLRPQRLRRPVPSKISVRHRHEPCLIVARGFLAVFSFALVWDVVARTVRCGSLVLGVSVSWEASSLSSSSIHSFHAPKAFSRMRPTDVLFVVRAYYARHCFQVALFVLVQPTARPLGALLYNRLREESDKNDAGRIRRPACNIAVIEPRENVCQPSNHG